MILLCVEHMPSNLVFLNTDIWTLAGRPCAERSKSSKQSYQADKTIQYTFSMHHNGS